MHCKNTMRTIRDFVDNDSYQALVASVVGSGLVLGLVSALLWLS
jgi:hypothetical protein